ncbi:hypothetical protein L208DRAFT_1411670 [Tricholoma matsutake]|nr:hypothetical protein L208DRAFT_1411670 [Tricholoma matsutake 945]
MPSFTVIFRACGKNGIARWWDPGRTRVRRDIAIPSRNLPLSLSAFFTLAWLPTATSNLLISSHAWYLVFADLRPSSERFPVGAVASGATVPAVPASSSLRYTFSSDLLSFPI